MEDSTKRVKYGDRIHPEGYKYSGRCDFTIVFPYAPCHDSVV